MVEKDYQLKTENNRLIFRTSSFKAEKSSVLPSGVYSKEFSSMLLASALSTLAYMFAGIMNIKSAVVRYSSLLLLFIAAFLGSNKYIFKESYLEADFDRSSETVTIVRSGIIIKKSEEIPFANIKSVDLGTRKFVPENVDGIKFVQKISAQHGSALPGLSDIEEFITLSLCLKDGSERIIYAGKIDVEPEIPVNEIRSFLNV